MFVPIIFYNIFLTRRQLKEIFNKFQKHFRDEKLREFSEKKIRNIYKKVWKQIAQILKYFINDFMKFIKKIENNFEDNKNFVINFEKLTRSEKYETFHY